MKVNQFLFCLVLVFCISFSGFADTWWWTDSGGDHDYNNPANWLIDGGDVPTAAPSTSQTLNIDNHPALGGPVLSDTGSAGDIWISVTDSGTLTVGPEAELTASGTITVSAKDPNEAKLFLNGGSVSAGILGVARQDDSSGYVEVNGSDFSAAQVWFGDNSKENTNAEMVINSGDFNINTTFVLGANSNTGSFFIDVKGGILDNNGTMYVNPNSGEAQINLSGGVFEYGAIRTLGSQILDVEDLIDAGVITGYADSFGGASHPRATFFIESGQVWAEIPADLGAAWSPLPGIDENLDGVELYNDAEYLSWKPGDNPQSYILYLSESEDDVINAVDSSSPAYVASIAHTGAVDARQSYPISSLGLELGKDYYWRVDQIDTSSEVHTGELWSFNFDDYQYLDSFGDYITIPITDVWTDNGLAGLTVVDDDSDDTEEYDAGRYAVLEFSNGGSMTRTVPFADLTRDNIVSMRVRYRVPDANELDLQVTLFDGSQSTTVTKSTLVVAPYWNDWNIDLADFTGVNPGDIQTISIGSTGSGLVEIEDIRLYIQRCVGEFAPLGDLDGDCTVDLDDYALMASSWKDADTGYSPDPLTTAPVAVYTFDEGIAEPNIPDSSGNDFEALVTLGDETPADFGGVFGKFDIVPGYSGDCLDLAYNADSEFTGSAQLMIPQEVFDAIGATNQMTISVWVYGEPDVYVPTTGMDAVQNMFFTTTRSEQGWGHESHIRLPWTWISLPGWNAGVWWGSLGPTAAWYLPEIQPADWEGQWNHYVFTSEVVSDNVTNAIYHNGELVSSVSGTVANDGQGNPLDLSGILKGAFGWVPGGGYVGKIDEVRFYDTILPIGEILTLADSSGTLIEMPNPEYDLVDDGEINIEDLAAQLQTWLDYEIWP